MAPLRSFALTLALCLAYGNVSADPGLPEARALRDHGRYDEALDILDGLVEGARAGRDTLLVRAMVLAEAGRAGEAETEVAGLLESDRGAVDVNLAAAYVYRLAGDPATALGAAQRVLESDPQNAEAYQHQVFSLHDLGAAGRALSLANARPEWFSRAELDYLRGSRAARQVRWGEISTPDPARRFDATDRALAMLDELWKTLPEDASEARLRNRRDRVLALRQRDRMDEAIAAFEAFEADGGAVPAYVLEAAADAYLYQRRPERAAALYRRVLEHDRWNYNARAALYWALIESERFSEAIRHIDALAAEKPRFRGDAPYWRKLYLDTTAAMARAMAHRPAEAETRLQTLLADAPASALIRRELGTVYRWRGWPARALEQAEIALAYEPDVPSGRLLHAAVLMDLERYAEAGDRIEALYREYPEDRHVQRQHAEWRNRRRWGMSVAGTYGDSDGFREFGSRDRRLETRVNAPWLGHHWRGYATHYYADARYPEGEADYDRIGAGLDWRRRRHHARLELHRNRGGEAETGFTAGYDFHLDDHWSFATRYASFSTEVPLRARVHGIDGERAELAARWRAHESFNTRLGLSRLSLSDGNVRYAGLLSSERRLLASAHHVTEGRFYLYGSRASQSGGPYFNPERDASATLELAHDWLTWRRYERRFSQRFVLGGGAYWQEGFGTHPVGDLRYEHEWHFTSTLRLRYGAGVSSRVYDGERERRVYGMISLEALF